MSTARMFEGNLALDLSGSGSGSQGFSVVDGGLSKPVSREVACAAVVLPVRSFEPIQRPAASARFAWEKFAILVVLFAFIVSAGFGIASAIQKNEAYAEIAYENVVVSSGDSVWSISEKHAVDGLSTAEVKQLIQEKNHLDSLALHPGDVLKVPASR